MAFWVHNYIYKGKGDSTLDLNIYDGSNAFEITGEAITPIRYGFDAYYYYSVLGELVAVEVYDGDGLEQALDYVAASENVESQDITISLKDNITGDVTVTQKSDVKITLEGNNNTYDGVILVDGKSSRYESTGLTVQNVNFSSQSISADAYINLGDKNNGNATRYTNNVTVKDCTFATTSESGVVAVKSYTGGDHNLNIIGCTVAESMHSLAQLTNVEKGLKFENCKVGSKNGVNLNNTPTFEMDQCIFDVKGYAIRVGVDNKEGIANTEQKTFTVSNSTLKSACDEDGDAVIVFRDNATYAKLTLSNTTLEGTRTISGNTESTIIEGLN